MTWTHRLRAAVPLAAALVGAASGGRAQGRTDASPCVRIAFGAWSPPLDWNGAGHHDSAARLGALSRRLRDSVFAGRVSASGRDEMQWYEEGDIRRLLLMPGWWPAGVLITFDTRPRDSIGRSAGIDTLAGEAVALVADGSRATPRAAARVIRAPCSGGPP